MSYEDAEEPEEVSRAKAVPKDLARTGRQFSLTDDWKSAKESHEDLGFWWTGRTECLQENGEYSMIQYELS